MEFEFTPGTEGPARHDPVLRGEEDPAPRPQVGRRSALSRGTSSPSSARWASWGSSSRRSTAARPCPTWTTSSSWRSSAAWTPRWASAWPPTTPSAPTTSTCGHGGAEGEVPHPPGLGQSRSAPGPSRSRAPGPTPPACKTTAVRKGDGWVLNGTKTFFTHATVGDIAVVIALTDKSDPHHGMHRLRRGEGHAGLPAGQEGGQARPARLRHRASSSSRTATCPTRTGWARWATGSRTR